MFESPLTKTTMLRFSQFARTAARLAGHPLGFLLAISVVVVWMLSGPLFDFSDTWQLVINTSTTVITFLMVFLIQHTQNRDMLALQVKLDEVVRAIKAARNSVLNLEELEDAELELLIQKYERLGRRSQHKREPPAIPLVAAAECGNTAPMPSTPPLGGAGSG